ncbi:MAG TPA: hypothetical protein VMU10_09755, partial [Desulfomonilia bacterium]|nr:hypothetical protein [Desulfomonilia bacterium]
LAAGTIIDGFIGFCTRESSRPREAFKEIEASPDEFADLLRATLIAGSRIDNSLYMKEAIRLCEDKNIELRRGAVFSIGKLNWPEGINVFDSALAVLERTVAMETDDQILSNVVYSAFALLQQDQDLSPRAIDLIVSALVKGDEYTLHDLNGARNYRRLREMKSGIKMESASDNRQTYPTYLNLKYFRPMCILTES